MIDGHVAAYRHLRAGGGNANDWILVAVARDAAPGLLGDVGAAPLAILAVALVLMTLAVISLRASRRELEKAATTDGLTGLANRRQLMADLERRTARPADPAVLLLFDLDGFKSYNDSFGHLAGDALLTRLGQALERSVQRHGRAYRLGGDEFCVLADAGARARGRARWRPRRWSSTATASPITASYGAVAIPERGGRRDRGAAHRRPAHVRAQELRPRDGAAPEHRRAPARARRAPSRPRGPPRRRGAPGRSRGPPPRPRGRGARPRPGGRRAARRGQGRHPRRHPQQARPAGRRRVGLHAPPHAHRRAHRRRRARSRPGRQAGARQPRALGRRRLPRRARRARTSRSARASSPSATRTTRSSSDRPYRRGAQRRGGDGRAAPLRRHAVRSRRWSPPSPPCSRPTGAPTRPRPPSPRAARSRSAYTVSPTASRLATESLSIVSFRPSA